MTLYAVPDDSGARLDVWLAAQVDTLTRSGAARLLEQGAVTVDGYTASKSTRLRGGEQITVTLPEPAPVDAKPENIPLDVVYEDADVIVVNKPAGMVVHPAPGHPGSTLVNALLYHCGGTLSGIN
ncbi:MAG: RNA pseudouridine synthase, partial [Oscillibacter sp.]|nr:RNA pseudouridine synthase [Oscillibacter sp.]